MTNSSTNNYDPIDYCIEISKMLEEQDKDEEKLLKLFKKLLEMYGGPEYLFSYANENDHMLGAFCGSIMDVAKVRRIPVEMSIREHYKLHINMPKGDLIFKPTDDEAEMRRREKVAEEVYKRVILGIEPEPERARRPGLSERILRFFRGNRDVPLI